MAEKVEIKITMKKDRVTLKFSRRWSMHGPIREHSSFTTSRRELERALRDAEITVPWKEVR